MKFTTKVAMWCALLATVALGIFAVAVLLAHDRAEIASLDEELAIEARHFLDEFERHGAKLSWVTQREFEEVMSISHDPHVFSEVIGPNGKALVRSKNLTGQLMGAVPAGSGWAHIAGKRMRAFSATKHGITIQFASDMAEEAEEEATLRHTMLVMLPLALLLVAVGAWFVSRHALRPVRVMAEVAGTIEAAHAGRRMPGAGAKDEIGQLARAFNGTLDRLEASLEQAMRFSADASHEMRTPLAVARAGLEELLRSPQLDTSARESVAETIEQMSRLTAITEQLLLLSRADGGRLALHIAPVDVAGIAREVAADFEMLGADAGLTFEVAAPASVLALADPQTLRQVFANLLDNAVKYNAPAGRIRVEVAADAREVRVTVGNTGPGIPAEHRARIFERFYRAEHTAEVHGTGLGLCLARELARAMGGELRLGASQDGWTEFILTLASAGQ